MKAKLLKKIRKRYSWYFKKNGFPVLIEHSIRRARVFDFEQCCAITNVNEEKMTKTLKTSGVSKDEWCLRTLKDVILKPFGWSMRELTYRAAVKNFNKK